MPPRFSTGAISAASAKAAWWKNGASGAPSPPSGEIARPEVRDGGAAGALGDHGRIADLERRAPLGVVGDGLSVRGDRVDLGERDARLLPRAPSADAAKRSPSSTSRPASSASTSPAGTRPAARSWMRRWNAAGKASSRKATSRSGRSSTPSGHSTSAASTPSADVPDINPITRTRGAYAR